VNGGRIDAQSPANPRQRPPSLVQPRSFVDLLRPEPTTAHRHVVAVQDLAHRPPLNPKLLTKLVDGGTGQVPRDEFLDLLAV
jgi:hypothetical protein